MIKIDDEMLDYIEILSKLSLAPQEREAAKSDMEFMLAYFDQLQELDTEGVEPLVQVNEYGAVLREDVETGVEGGGLSAGLANAPAQKENCFKVPKTIA